MKYRTAPHWLVSAILMASLLPGQALAYACEPVFDTLGGYAEGLGLRDSQRLEACLIGAPVCVLDGRGEVHAFASVAEVPAREAAYMAVLQTDGGDCLSAVFSGGSAAAWLFMGWQPDSGTMQEIGALAELRLNSDAVPWSGVVGMLAEADAANRAARERAATERCARLAEPAEFTAGSAMQAIFCSYDLEHQATLLPLRFTAPWSPHDAETLAKPVLVQTWQVGGQEKGVLVVARQQLEGGEPYVSHGTGTAISVYVFNRDGDRWRYEKGKKYLFEDLGTYGEAPPMKLIRLGRKRYGIKFDTGYASMGYYEASTLLVSLSEQDFPVMGSFDVIANNEGTGDDPWGYEARLEMVEREDADYYDLRLVFEGSMKVWEGPESRIELRDEIQCLRVVDGRYVADEQATCLGAPAVMDTDGPDGEL